MSYRKITVLTAIILFAATSHIVVAIPKDANVIKVCGGEYHTLIVTKNNWAWGSSVSGEVGDGNRGNRLTPVYVHAGQQNPAALSSTYYAA